MKCRLILCILLVISIQLVLSHAVKKSTHKMKTYMERVAGKKKKKLNDIRIGNLPTPLLSVEEKKKPSINEEYLVLRISSKTVLYSQTLCFLRSLAYPVHPAILPFSHQPQSFVPSSHCSERFMVPCVFRKEKHRRCSDRSSTNALHRVHVDSNLAI